MAFETVGVKITLEGVAAFERGMERVGRSTERAGKKIMAVEERSKIFNKTLNRMGIALLAAGGAATAFIFSATKLAARVQTLGVVTVTLGRNIGKTEEEIRELEQAVVDQGITLRGARRSIALMIQSQLDLSKATKLARLAQNAAVIANINSTEAFERLVFVITSGNVRMARTLGLQVSFQRAYEDTAEALGKTTLELTEQEKITARTNAVLEIGSTIANTYADAMETVGKKVLSLPRHLEESRRILGEAWLPIYAEAVDFVTRSLQTWENLDSIQQTAISTTLGFVAAATAFLGIVAVAIPQIAALSGAFTTLAAAMFGTGTIVFSASAVLGILVVAIGATIVAIALLVKSMATWKKMGEEIDDAIRKQISTLNKAEVSQEDYEKEIRRIADVSNRAVISLDEYNQLIARGGLFARAAQKSVVLLTEAQRNMTSEVEASDRAMIRYGRSLLVVGEAEEELVEDTEALAAEQKKLSEQFQAIKQLASVDLTQAFEDYRGKVEELNATIVELESRTYLTKKQKEELADAREELEKTNAAWKKNTAVVIASLFEQAIAIGGFTEEEIVAFALLQEQLGLVDEGYAALTAAVFGATKQLDEQGDQSAETVEDMFELFQSMIDPTLQAGALANEINRIQSKQATVTTTFRTIRETRTVTARGGSVALQGGGFAQRGRAHLVGERGPEIFVPGQSGTVLKNAFVQALSSISSMLRGISPALGAAGVGGTVTNLASTSSQMTNNFNLNIATQAPVEPIVADFRSMQSLANAI